jgi:predicted RNA polymerase sigma factor
VAAVGQRITRAKNKIRTANIPLRVPPAELLAERTPHALGCIYSVFTEDYWSTGGPSAIRDELCDEGVLAMLDSPVVRANRALAIGFRDGFPAGLAALDEQRRRTLGSANPSSTRSVIAHPGRLS